MKIKRSISYLLLCWLFSISLSACGTARAGCGLTSDAQQTGQTTSEEVRLPA
ncbi:MAG: hypothetical protein QGH06_01690 [Lutibacter sp.]|nr:hypothetical protein [Lutibacter sp.]